MKIFKILIKFKMDRKSCCFPDCKKPLPLRGGNDASPLHWGLCCDACKNKVIKARRFSVDLVSRLCDE